MPAYRYKALNTNGRTERGVMEADSERAVRRTLREQGLNPLAVTPVTETEKNAGRRFFTRGKRMKISELALVTRQLATLLSAGLPVEEALQGVSEQTEKEHITSIIAAVRSKVLEGHSLATGLRQFPRAFPPLYCATVEAGEQTGRLDVILNRLADYAEQQQQMRQKIQQALIYPSVMTVVSLGIVIFLLQFVVPKIIDVFSSTGQGLPDITLILIDISKLLRDYGLYLLGALLLGIIAFSFLLKKPPLKRRWHQLLLKTPLINYMIKTINTARYARTLGILSNAGVPLLEAMRVSASLIMNIPMYDAVNSAAQQVKEGISIHIALQESHYFSPMMIHLIASGENSGQLENMLERAADHQDTEVTRLIETGLTLFEPMIILIMGSVVLFIVLAILLPIFDMGQFVR